MSSLSGSESASQVFGTQVYVGAAARTSARLFLLVETESDLPRLAVTAPVPHSESVSLVFQLLVEHLVADVSGECPRSQCPESVCSM